MDEHAYTITTESVADIPPAQLGALHVRVLPLEYRIGSGAVLVDDGAPEAGDAVCAALRERQPISVAMAGTARFAAFWTPELMRGRDILHLSLSSGLGGLYDAAAMAADGCLQRFPARRILVVDSLAVSGGLSLLAARAARYRADGLPLAACRARVEGEKRAVQHLVAIRDPSRLTVSGHLRPQPPAEPGAGRETVLSLDAAGRLVRRRSFPDRLSALRFLRDVFSRTAEEGESPLIRHTGAAGDAERLAELLVRTAYAPEPVQSHAGASTAAHAGPGAVAMFYFGHGRV